MEAARLYYSFELAPGFWKWLVSAEVRAHICSIESVREEICRGTGDLVDWATHTAPPDLWRPVTPEIVEAALELSEWAADGKRPFTQAAVAGFLDSCGYWLIAEAMATGSTVVTREVSAPGGRAAIKIPDVCRAFGARCEQPFPVYRKLGLKLG